jgi:hypothetical protein
MTSLQEPQTMRGVLGSLKFLFVGPFLVVMLFVINLMTSPGQWWFQWAALGIGIAWFINLFRVLRALAIIGGLAGLAALLNRRGLL